MMASNVIPMSPIGNVDAEAALCGAMMSDAKLIDSVADTLDPEDFSDRLMGRIYSTIVREHSLGRSANPVTLRPYFADDQDMAQVGGPGYLAELTAAVNLIGARDFAKQIADLARRRRLVDGLTDAAAMSADPELTVEELIDAADAAVTGATKAGEGIHQPTGAQCLAELIDTFNEPIRGATCGHISAVDRLLGPLRPKQLVIGAGRPGMGKTAFALSYALGAARRNHGTLFVSLEMSSTELAARMAADLCFGHDPIPFQTILEARPTPEQARRICRARETVEDWPLQIIDAGNLTVGRLSMMVRRHQRRMVAKGQTLELVIVDYLQLMRPDRHMKSAYEAVSEVSRGLKAIAKDHGVAVLALAQLSREVEKRQDKRPQLSDLRDSGQIEQDADAVLFLVRDEYYLRQIEPEDKDSAEYLKWEEALAKAQGAIEFICAKRRNGRTGKAWGAFHGEYQAVRDEAQR
jgi:replicative DNA helicase